MSPVESGVERGFVGKDALKADALARYTIQARDLFLDILAAAADSVRNNEDLSAALPITFTIDLQPDVARTISFALLHVNITAFTLTIIGVNGKGEAVTETFTAASGWTFETVEAYATITSIKLAARTGTGAADTCDVGMGSKLGLSLPLDSVVGVFKATKNKADYPAASYTVDATYDLVDVSTGAAIVADDDFCISYRALLEQCNSL